MKSLKGKGKTNWDKLRAKRKSTATASEEQREDAHKLWSDADVVIPGGKTRMTVRFDTDLVDWFKSKGPKYQTRMNIVLRQFMEKQNAKIPFSAKEDLYVSEPTSSGINLWDVTKAEYLRALNSLGEISLHNGDVEKATKYFETVVDGFLSFLTKDMKNHPERISPVSPKAIKKASRLTKDVVVADDDTIDDDATI